MDDPHKPGAVTVWRARMNEGECIVIELTCVVGGAGQRGFTARYAMGSDPHEPAWKNAPGPWWTVYYHRAAEAASMVAHAYAYGTVVFLEMVTFKTCPRHPLRLATCLLLDAIEPVCVDCAIGCSRVENEPNHVVQGLRMHARAYAAHVGWKGDV